MKKRETTDEEFFADDPELYHELVLLEQAALPLDANGQTVFDRPVPYPEAVTMALRLCHEAGWPIPRWCVWATERMAKDLRDPPKRKQGGDPEFKKLGARHQAMVSMMEEYPNSRKKKKQAMWWAAQELENQGFELKRQSQNETDDDPPSARAYREAYRQVQEALDNWTGKHGESGIHYQDAPFFGVDPYWPNEKLSTPMSKKKSARKAK